MGVTARRGRGEAKRADGAADASNKRPDSTVTRRQTNPVSALLH